jgi:hypothetical protein
MVGSILSSDTMATTPRKDPRIFYQRDGTSSTTISTQDDDYLTASISTLEDTVVKPSKRVTFQEAVHIYEFPMILGDNPSCSSGPPMMLLWPIDRSAIECSTETLRMMQVHADRRYERSREHSSRRNVSTLVFPQGPPVRSMTAAERTVLLQYQDPPWNATMEEMTLAMDAVARIQGQRLASFSSSCSLWSRVRQRLFQQRQPTFSSRREKQDGPLPASFIQDPAKRIQHANQVWNQHHGSVRKLP